MIIPAIDILDGRVVRLRQGAYDHRINYDVDPVALIGDYIAQGASWIHVVDLSGAANPERRQLELIQRIVLDAGAKVQVGGGIRTRDDVANLLNAGASRAVVGSVAIDNPDRILEWSTTLPQGSILPAIDVRPSDGDEYIPVTRGWTEEGANSLHDLLDLYSSNGFAEILMTDVSRDGMMNGPNISLYQKMSAGRNSLRFQVSGGISSLQDLEKISSDYAAGIIVGRALLEGSFTVEQALACWPSE